MKTLFLSSIVLLCLATAGLAAPLAGVPPLPEGARPAVVTVAQDGLPNSGRVSEAIPAGKYTYLRVKQNGKETWLAIPGRDIPVGAEISYGQGAVMKDFHSGSLKRTFAEVLFLGGVTVAGETASAVPPGHPTVPADPNAEANLPNIGQVSEAIPAGKYTYLHVTRDGKETWIAIPRQDIPVGARVRYADTEPMKDFHSPSLDRTFAEILFLGGVLVAEH